jgi:hypothetical protein
MEKELRDQLATATLAIRRLLEDEFARQLEGVFDIFPDGRINDHPSDTLTLDERLIRSKVVASIERRRAKGEPAAESVYAYMRECAFTFLNRLAAFKMMEARGLVQECVSRGSESAGFKEFCGLAPGLTTLPDNGYRLYIESLCDEIGREVGELFNRFDSGSLLWPARRTLANVLAILNDQSLAGIWAGDETIGWIYQYYNDPEERAIMRDLNRGGSAAPRNSRELAVRNQFFTPRYVVEFLTDNTLGRIWYEMTKGETKLKEQCHYLIYRPHEIFLKLGETSPEQPGKDNLSQEDLLKQPALISHRPLKDPRTILMLDPACGSMHFGLYAFDLFEVIYDEAWELEEKLGVVALGRPPGMNSLHDSFANKNAYLKAVPSLIVEQNIYGIDIDPRAAQIAGLALWLRAQRAWKALKPAERPAIRRSNIVCAEPMPGDDERLKEFCSALKQPAIGQMVEVIFDKMHLAGDAGSLLRIEEEISGLVHSTKLRWSDSYRFDQAPSELFTKAEIIAFSRPKKSSQTELDIDFTGITDEAFWDKAEERIYSALRSYAEQAENGGGFQRRLFAEDAARGFAFIDVCRKRYDVVVMNPPFGDRVLSCESLFEEEYGDGKLDLYHYFYERADQMRSVCGRVGAITPRTLLYQAHYLGLREKWLDGEIKPEAIAELDLGVLDGATVRPALGVLGKSSLEQRTFYSNLKHTHTPAVDLRDAIMSFRAGNLGSRCTFHAVARFAEMPGKRFSLWATDRILNSFLGFKTLEPALGKVTEGLSNEDDMRFLRCWWEIPCSNPLRWRPFGKFDARSTFIADFSIVIDWSPSAYRALGEVGNRRANESFYFRSGCAFTRSCEVGMAATTLPEGVVFSGVSRYFLPNSDARLGLLAYLNSSLVEGLHLVLTPDRDRISGTLRKLPVVVDSATLESLQATGTEIWKQKLLWLASTDETQRLFWDALGRVSAEGGSAQRESHCSMLRSRINELEQLVEDIVTSACPFRSEDLAVIKEEVKERSGERDLVTWSPDICSNNGAAAGMILSALGCAFGRWDIRYATGERATPELPDPFAPLPFCPPGQLQNAQGLPARREDMPATYPVQIPWDGILVDDPNHPLDVERRVRGVIEVIWRKRAEAIEHEACEILGVKSLRDYFRKPVGFFADHLKRYSKSRRQAPIYWLLSSPKGLYSIWLYYHRLSADTLFTALRDHAKPRLEMEERHLFNLKQAAGPSPTPSQAREIATSEEFVEDLRTFHDELQRVAPMWRPDLNDGVIINHAPLWRLVLHTGWRKSLKETWDSLVAGDYDWAHLALQLWPERVIPKCASDRLLAIAHDLERFFWVEDANTGKWSPLQRTDAEIDKLIAERTSPAVKASLDSLVAAPTPSGATTKRGRRAQST